MLKDSVQKTLGEEFILNLQSTESDGLMFAALEDMVAVNYPQSDLIPQVKKLSDFESVVKWQGKLARVRIEQNAKAVREIGSRLIGLNNFGKDNYKYKDKIVRKLNLLVNNRPTLDEMIYITMASYIERGWGSVEDFKSGLEKHVKENAPIRGCDKLPVRCVSDVCSV